MALYGVRLVINLFDLCIYRRYLEEFIGNRKTSMEFSVLLLIVCELIGSAVNQMGISWLNFVTMVAILCVYVCQYEAGILSRLIAVLLYMGIMGVAEPLGYLFNEYSCAMKSHFRKIGNQMSGSGNHLCEFTRVMFYLDRIPLASICHVQHQCL